jgi:hypothetical protein
VSDVVAVHARTARLSGVALAAAGAAWAVSPVHPPLVCPLRALTGIPCPVCGMTRAVSAAMEGHLWESLRFQPAGLALLLLGVVLLVRRGRDPVRVPVWTVLTVLALMWAWNLTLNPTFH